MFIGLTSCGVEAVRNTLANQKPSGSFQRMTKPSSITQIKVKADQHSCNWLPNNIILRRSKKPSVEDFRPINNLTMQFSLL